MIDPLCAKDNEFFIARDRRAAVAAWRFNARLRNDA